VAIKIGTYNIRSGRAGNLEGALCAMHKMHMDIVILKETKLKDERHTKRAFGYDVVATKAISPHQEGVSLIYMTSEYWQVESVRCHGPNVIGFQLVTGEGAIIA
jgi:exonuclease III